MYPRSAQLFFRPNEFSLCKVHSFSVFQYHGNELHGWRVLAKGWDEMYVHESSVYRDRKFDQSQFARSFPAGDPLAARVEGQKAVERVASSVARMEEEKRGYPPWDK